MKKKIAVKDIALFLYSSGDLTADFFSNNSKVQGKSAHSFLQKKYNDQSEKEYYIKYNYSYQGYDLEIHGYMDGLLVENGQTIIEEIKSTTVNLDLITLDYHKEHLAQLMLYAYLYAQLNALPCVNIRLTYIEVEDYKTKSFNLTKTYEELKTFFLDSIKAYYDWILILEETSVEKMKSIYDIKFPFTTKRKGQQELMKASYYTLMHKEILYVIAPTGIGKTIATLFPAIKTITNPNEKLFYLTAKTMGREVVLNTINLLVKLGLKMKSIVISSKQKTCLIEKKHCEPENCPYAKGYFNKLRKAIEDIYQQETIFDSDKIKEYAIKHEICPFEFSLDLSYFCDFIICDYNYVFDPKAHLIRYFEEDSYETKILCDEAHNLIQRSKDMYSAVLSSDTIFELEDLLKQYNPELTKVGSLINSSLKKYDESLNKDLFYYSHYLDDSFIKLFLKVTNICETILSDQKKFENREKAVEDYFIIKDFIDTSNWFGPNHLFMVKKEKEKYILHISCCDASEFIHHTILTKTNGIIFFSATLFPIKYHMDLLTEGCGKYLVLPSPFNKKNLRLIIKTDISTKYKDREKTAMDISKVILSLVNHKKGNYIAFFPSYKYIELVLPLLQEANAEIIIQLPQMTDYQRAEYFNRFKNTEKSHLGLFVLGGSFSEGLDFVGNLLNGVVIVGVGIPQVNIENNLLKEFFDEKYQNGFDYAYSYPGFNKVVQAAGRVIRDEKDKGVVILIDQRYKYRLYQDLMPASWDERIEENSLSQLERLLIEFNEETRS